MRTCILSLPRSGSQYCEKLISSLSNGATELNEFFHSWIATDYYIEDGILTIGEATQGEPALKLHPEFKHRIELLSNANPSQNFTIRMFLLTTFDKDNLSYIVQELSKINFKFVYLERNFRDIVKSFGVAASSWMSGHPVWVINSELPNCLTVKIEETKALTDIFYESYLKRKELLSMLNIPYSTVRYDNLVTDITTVFGSCPSYVGNRTINKELEKFVTNSKEFIDLINSYEL